MPTTNKVTQTHTQKRYKQGKLVAFHNKTAMTGLLIAVGIYIILFVWHTIAARLEKYPGPYQDPWRLFGIVAFVIVVSTFAYTLRRRFVPLLPGRVQSWLWLHIWFGSVSVLIALLHTNNNFSLFQGAEFSFTTLTRSFGGVSALYALSLLVLSGLIGRFLDMGLSRIIAHEASSNGVGIVQSLQDQLRELELTIKRLCAGKSDAFKNYCLQALSKKHVPTQQPTEVAIQEQADFQLVCDMLSKRSRLIRSRDRQQYAHNLIKLWRSIHIPLAYIAFIIIAIHSLTQLFIWLQSNGRF